MKARINIWAFVPYSGRNGYGGDESEVYLKRGSGDGILQVFPDYWAKYRARLEGYMNAVYAYSEPSNKAALECELSILVDGWEAVERKPEKAIIEAQVQDFGRGRGKLHNYWGGSQLFDESLEPLIGHRVKLTIEPLD